MKIAEDLETEMIKRKIKSSVAVMGCVVNGPENRMSQMLG
jgi:(E)-4-hydroxy-3-methylbut-2-enyl-diphosphate synthase